MIMLIILISIVGLTIDLALDIVHLSRVVQVSVDTCVILLMVILCTIFIASATMPDPGSTSIEVVDGECYDCCH